MNAPIPETPIFDPRTSYGQHKQTMVIFDPRTSYGQHKQAIVDAFERLYLTQLLARNHGNLSAAAREARMDRKHLHELAQKHGMRPVKR